MACKPLRPCRHPGCHVLVHGGYCDQHKPRDVRSADSRAYHSWYSLPIWTDDLRPTQLLHEPFCQECTKRGKRTKATDVDHNDPHDGDWSKFTDRGNLRSLCHRCHSAKTMRESQAKRRKKLG